MVGRGWNKASSWTSFVGLLLRTRSGFAVLLLPGRGERASLLFPFVIDPQWMPFCFVWRRERLACYKTVIVNQAPALPQQQRQPFRSAPYKQKETGRGPLLWIVGTPTSPYSIDLCSLLMLRILEKTTRFYWEPKWPMLSMTIESI